MEKKTTLESLKPFAVTVAEVLKAAVQVADEVLSEALHRYSDRPETPNAAASGSEHSEGTREPSGRARSGEASPVAEPGPVAVETAPKMAWVTFETMARTAFGQTVCVVGDAPSLGAWDPQRAVRLVPTEYPKCQGRVQVEAWESIEYKYVRDNGDGSFTWEASSGNRMLKGLGAPTHDLSPDEIDWGD
jgi:hypothetical protein